MQMTSYYKEKLSAGRLQCCYDMAPPRVRQYLEAEIRHVIDRLRATDVVLELGCGYGRVAFRLAQLAARVVGIDVAEQSIAAARSSAGPDSRCEFIEMDALDLHFTDSEFDVGVCIQNGICAFGCDQQALLREALRVVRPGGRVLLSTYSDRFWHERLAWFEAQAEAGLLGRIDHAASRDGVIACIDGFRSGRATPDELRALCASFDLEPLICEVDGSCVFCEIVKPAFQPETSTGASAS
jgi:ubiquinone/menaquinone biosynthesis C-methylase UbiE